MVLIYGWVAASYIYGSVPRYWLDPVSSNSSTYLRAFQVSRYLEVAFVPCSFYFCYFYIKSFLLLATSSFPPLYLFCNRLPGSPSPVMAAHSGHNLLPEAARGDKKRDCGQSITHCLCCSLLMRGGLPKLFPNFNMGSLPLSWTWGKVLAAPQKSHPCRLPNTKTWPHKLNRWGLKKN